MSTLTADIRTALGATPIRTLTDQALRRELAALEALRHTLRASLRPLTPQVPAGPASAETSLETERSVKRVPVSKGSIFSRRVPAAPSVQAKEQASEKLKCSIARPSAAELAAAERAAALAAGVEKRLYRDFVLRVQLLQAESAARLRKVQGIKRPTREPWKKAEEAPGAIVHASAARKPLPASVSVKPNATGNWLRVTPEGLERSG